ncbi:MAG: diguanylate cyclase [Gammaproteobacteria bacterium]|nr:diguanylate cyclase [Gammaproteobacteria bacterium]
MGSASSRNSRTIRCPGSAEAISVDRNRLSIGVASVVPENGQAPEILFRSADTALYDSKNKGRNQIDIHPAVDSASPRGRLSSAKPVVERDRTGQDSSRYRILAARKNNSAIESPLPRRTRAGVTGYVRRLPGSALT